MVLRPRNGQLIVISSLEVVLNGGEEQDIPLIQYRLPYSFVIASRLPPRTRSHAEDMDAVDAVDPRPSKLRRTDPGCVGRVGGRLSQGVGPSHPAELSSGDSGGPTNNIPSGTSDPPAASMDNCQLASSEEALISSRQRRQTLNTADDEEAADSRDLVIHRVVPNRGPTIGGPDICIWGSNFPTDNLPLYARFGDNFAHAVGMLSPSFGKHLIASRFLNYLTCSCALSRKLVPQALFQ